MRWLVGFAVYFTNINLTRKCVIFGTGPSFFVYRGWKGTRKNNEEILLANPIIACNFWLSSSTRSSSSPTRLATRSLRMTRPHTTTAASRQSQIRVGLTSISKEHEKDTTGGHDSVVGCYDDVTFTASTPAVEETKQLSTSTSPRPTRIAIIGGGAAGLVMARIIQRDMIMSSETTTVTIFEQTNTIGGVWNYTPKSLLHNTDHNLTSDTIPSSSLLEKDSVASIKTTKITGTEATIRERSTIATSTSTTRALSKTHNPMYRGLRTNLPKEIMSFREYPWISTITNTATATTTTKDVSPDPSFVTHDVVLKYLQSYANHYQLHEYIQTNAQIRQLTILPHSISNIQYSHTISDPADQNNTYDKKNSDTVAEVWPCIQLDWTTSEDNCTDGSISTFNCYSGVFDAVCVCNGHYSRPYIPINKIIGFQQYFRGQWMHSIDYDDPTWFENQTVLCIGGRASGSDIARECIGFGKAKHVYLSDTSCEHFMGLTEHNITWVPATIEILSTGQVRFDQDCPINPFVDWIIFCTGYEYDFPFVNTAKSNLNLEWSNRRVQPLYEQLWHAQYPNLVFVGIPHSIIPFPLFELQAEAVVQQWKQSITPQLPNALSRVATAKLDSLSGGEGKAPLGRIPEDTHYLGNKQWDYCRRMARYANLGSSTFLDNYIHTNQTIYEHTAMLRQGDFPAAPDSYRDINYERKDGDHTVQAWPLATSLSFKAA